MTDYIIARILEIINGVGDMGTGIIIQTPQAFNDTLYNCAKTLQEDAAKPLGCIILGLVFMWELYNITIRNEGMNNMGWMIPFKAMFKIVVCKTVLDNIGLIL
jgi:hypothetical protein